MSEDTPNEMVACIERLMRLQVLDFAIEATGKGEHSAKTTDYFKACMAILAANNSLISEEGLEQLEAVLSEAFKWQVEVCKTKLEAVKKRSQP